MAIRWIIKRTVLSAITYPCLLVAMMTFSTLANSLPPEIEVDRFIIAAKKHIAAKEYDAAEDYLLRAVELNIELPVDFYYAYGQVLFYKKDRAKARQNLEVYVKTAGKNGDFYHESLELINLLEEKEATPVVEQKAKLDWSSLADAMKVEDGYVRELKAFYLTEDDREALQLHINSLLSVYHIGNVSNLRRVSTMNYVTSISLSDGMIYSSMRTYDKNSGDARAVSAKFNVFGVNPYVSYGCEPEAMNCWIAHPVDGSKWIRIVNDSSAAKDLVKALTHLIKAMQQT